MPILPNQCPYQISTSYTLSFLRYSLDKIFKLKVTMAKSKVKSRSHHDVAHLHPLANVPTKYQFPTHYGVRDTRWTTSFRHPPIRSPWVKTNTPTAFKGCGVKMCFCCCHMTSCHLDSILIYINYILMSNIFEKYNTEHLQVV